ncbi:MAG: DUF3482 domain-containing protein, partial [Gammaproteobacteria bacterium]|nr:DUF3482 domain-containing protein [Gammaproteobacteria bacterium]
ALELRGHAAQEQIQLQSPQEHAWRSGDLAQPLITARAYPAWSSLNGSKPRQDSERSEAIADLAASLAQQTTDI